MVKIYMLPVGVGDFFWIRFGEGNNTNHNILIDGGYKKYSNYFYKKIIEKIDSEHQTVLVILTHFDADHIQGAADGLAALPSDLLMRVIDKIYFNTGRGVARTLTGKNTLFHKPGEKMPEDQVKVYVETFNYSLGDAVSFLEMIEQKGLTSKLIDYTDAGTELLYGGAEIKFISPGREELQKMLNQWEKYEQKQSIRYMSTSTIKQKDIEFLWNEKLGNDGSISNRSSLAFIFEYEDVKGAFLGDAVASVLIKGLEKLAVDFPYALDFIKISHHGGRNNMSDELIEMIPTKNYLISTEGIPSENVPSKVLLSHLVKIAKNVRLFNNYEWWTIAYNNQFFSNVDIQDYINTGKLELVKLTYNPITIKENLELYSFWRNTND